VVRWIELPNGGAEPEHPAPTITLTKAAQAAAPVVKNDDSGTATTLDTLGLVAGLLGLAAGVAAVIRSGRRASASGRWLTVLPGGIVRPGGPARYPPHPPADGVAEPTVPPVTVNIARLKSTAPEATI